MASPTQWTWVWVNSGIWWCTGRPGVLQSIGLQRVRLDWVTELKILIRIEWVNIYACILDIVQFNYTLELLSFLHDSVTGWDLGPRILHCSACTWTNISQNNKIQRNIKGLKITACMQQLGQIMDKRYFKTKTKLSLLKSKEQMQGAMHALCTQYHKWGRETTKPPRQSHPWTHSYSHPI